MPPVDAYRGVRPPRDHHGSPPLAPRVGVALVLLLVLMGTPQTASAEPLADLQARFQRWSGARLLFSRAALPPGSYHDRMPELSPARRLRAARILVREVKKYPRGYLGRMGFQAFGAFRACVSLTGDGFRPFERELGGYRYYGIWNGRTAAAGAYYTDGQLPLTFHHEIFHHVDATRDGKTADLHFKSDDRRFARAVAGREPYPAPAITARTLAALRRRSSGSVLEAAVSDYSEKAAGEDQAETARYLMSHLPDALIQIAERPGLPGSQRILHVLDAYTRAARDGPTIAWLVRAATSRAPSRP